MTPPITQAQNPEALKPESHEESESSSSGHAWKGYNGGEILGIGALVIVGIIAVAAVCLATVALVNPAGLALVGPGVAVALTFVTEHAIFILIPGAVCTALIGLIILISSVTGKCFD